MKQEKAFVLVTGATGFIGRPLVSRLRESGKCPVALTRDPERAASLLGRSVPCIATLEALPDGKCEALINLAGEPLANGRWSARRKAAFYESRVSLTESLVVYFQRRGQFPARVVNGSAIGYYGDRGDSLLTESLPAGEGFAAELCRDWEAAAAGFAEGGSRLCLLRTGIVLAGEGGALASMLPAFRLGLGGRLGSGRQWMSWIHRHDLVEMILHCLDHDTLSGPVNGVSPSPVTNAEFAKALGRALHRPSVFPVPAAVLRLMMGEMADQLLLASQRVLPEAALNSGYTFRYPQLDLALSAMFSTRDE